MTDKRAPDNAVRLYLCECGPIIRDAIDLGALGERLFDRVSDGPDAQVGGVVQIGIGHGGLLVTLDIRGII